MNNYKDFENFLQAVEKNNTSYIQTELADMIITLDGDKGKILEAIEYARANSEFHFQKHSATDTIREADTIQDAFYTERAELNFNFSEERLLKTIVLYQQMKRVEKEQKDSDTKSLNSKNKNSEGKIPKEFIFASGLIVGGIIIYTLINYFNGSGN